jgi:hypothetical protein
MKPGAAPFFRTETRLWRFVYVPPAHFTRDLFTADVVALSFPPLTHQVQFASDKNFEHAHRCYDQALQMNPESVCSVLSGFLARVR